MTIKIYLELGGHHSLVRDQLRNTYLLFFNKKKSKYEWHNIKWVVEHGARKGWEEVEFEKWEHAKELINYHPEVARKRIGGYRNTFAFFGDKAKLQIGKTDKWTKW